MAVFSPSDFRRALSAAQNGGAAAVAFDLSQLMETVMADPRYADFERRMGPGAARQAATQYGLDVLGADQPVAAFNLRPDANVEAASKRHVFNLVDGMTHGLSSERKAQLSDRVFDHMSQQERVQLASLGTGAAAASSIVAQELSRQCRTRTPTACMSRTAGARTP